jgi:hypothetical protein
MADETASGSEGFTPLDPAEIEALLEAMESEDAQEAPEMPDEYLFLDERLKLQDIKIKRKHAKQDIELRRKYASWLLAILAIELVVVNAMFWMYAEQGKNWAIPEGVMQIWLGATVVQVVGVVTVVTRYLFPRRDAHVEPPGVS